MFLSSTGVNLKDEAKSQWEDRPDDCVRVLAGMCSLTTAISAFAVPQKGADAEGYAARSLVEDISWLGHARVAVQSDNEPAGRGQVGLRDPEITQGQRHRAGLYRGICAV